MKDNVVHVGTNSISRGIVEDGTFNLQTTYYDDKSLNQNSRIRNSGVLNNSKLDLHEGEDVRGVISCPSIEQWNLFKKVNPTTYKLIHSTLEHERVKGLKEVSLLHPAWIVQLRL